VGLRGRGGRDAGSPGGTGREGVGAGEAMSETTNF
jgi:hypothetical protein